MQTRSEIIDTIREKFPAEYGLGLIFESVTMSLRSNSERLIDDLRKYFGSFVTDVDDPGIVISAYETPEQKFPFKFRIKDPDPGKTRIKEEWCDLPDGRIVRKRLTGMHFLFGFGDNVAIGPCVENSNQIVNFINNRYIEMRLQDGCLLGHAAGVVHNGKGLALAGFSGAGKSTLALHLLSLGASFISNDRLMVENDGNSLVMHGVAKLPRINPGTALNNENLKNVIPIDERKQFEELTKNQLWELEHKYDVLIEQCFGADRFMLSGPMDVLAILNWRRDDSPVEYRVINPEDRTDLVMAFMKSTGLFYLPYKNGSEIDRTINGYTELLSKCTVYEISGGIDFDAASEACMNFMRIN